jgi:hypothetical protein
MALEIVSLWQIGLPSNLPDFAAAHESAFDAVDGSSIGT